MRLWHKPFTMQLAPEDDLFILLDILIESAIWLNKKGVKQWPGYPSEFWRRRATRAIDQQVAYLAFVGGDAVGTVCLQWTDGYWYDDQLAGYVHNLAIRDRMHGQGFGVALLDWCKGAARKQGKSVLRLDCLASNGRLRQYYLDYGFQFRGEVIDNDYSAVLFEMNL